MTTTTSWRATLQVDVVERLEVAEALVHALELDDRVAGARRLGGVGEHGAVGLRFGRRVIWSPPPVSVSSRWLSRLIVYDTVQNSRAANASDSGPSS